MKYILDSSAVIAALYEEKGGDDVKAYLPEGMMSTVNLTEVLSYIIETGIAEEQAIRILQDININIIEYNEEQACIAASLKQKTRKYGLSLGDRACFALANKRNLPILTADRIWETIDLGVKVKLIR